jgi:hypothetical protein
MDGLRFDNFARRLSRRKAIGAAGATGLVAAASRVLPAAAQDGVTCQMSVQALTSAGPSVDTAYAGVLAITLGDDGSIDTGSLAFTGGPTVPVVGQADGRALSLRATFPNGNALVLTGTGENEIATCSGALSGVFGGPELGDTGSWLIDPAQSVRSGGAAPITPATPVPSPTVNPECAAVSCLDTYVMDPETCECLCPEHYEGCGPVCCPGGSICVDEASGECTCPEDTELCGDWCEPVCEMGYHRDYDSCACVEGCDPTPCPDGQQFSDVSCTCESYCNTNSETPFYCGGTCYEESYTECNGQCYPTASLNSNSDMCGVSCQVCPDGVPCIGGSCQCPATYDYCQGAGCKSLSDDSDNCGDCGHVCAVGTSCQGGTCQL